MLTKNTKRSFLDVLIETNNKMTSLLLFKTLTNNNSCTLNFKSECPFQYIYKKRNY